VGVDSTDDFDVPREAVDVPAVAAGPDVPAGPAGTGVVVVEVRDRFEYYESLRETVRRVCAETPESAESPGPAESPESAGSWAVAAERFRGMWAEHCERWPAEAREPVDRSADPPGSWRGDSGRYLDSAANAEVEERCEWIAETERSVVTPAMREIEACDPDRHLVGFDHRLKAPDRLKDKVAHDIEDKGRTTPEALASVKDIIRYTFVYREEGYTDGVQVDIARMESAGFKQVERRNTWTDNQYRGINSRWRTPDGGQIFEVQFHTTMSFEAKQLTHGAYERSRDPTTDRAELRELRYLQIDICRQIPVPPGVTDIPDYPEESS
jgi:hypothetical protein